MPKLTSSFDIGHSVFDIRNLLLLTLRCILLLIRRRNTFGHPRPELGFKTQSRRRCGRLIVLCCFSRFRRWCIFLRFRRFGNTGLKTWCETHFSRWGCRRFGSFGRFLRFGYGCFLRWFGRFGHPGFKARFKTHTRRRGSFR